MLPEELSEAIRAAGFESGILGEWCDAAVVARDTVYKARCRGRSACVRILRQLANASKVPMTVEEVRRVLLLKEEP